MKKLDEVITQKLCVGYSMGSYSLDTVETAFGKWTYLKFSFGANLSNYYVPAQKTYQMTRKIPLDSVLIRIFSHIYEKNYIFS